MLLKTKPTCWIYIISFLVLFLALSSSLLAYAQSRIDLWTVPVNLSHSGSTNNPVAARDSDGIIHVIWQDRYADSQEQQAGYVYTRFEGGNWSQPVVEIYPFEDLPPLLLPDSSGSIHAFWLTSDGSIAYSRMSATSQGLISGEVLYLAESAVDFQAVIDSNDDLHLAYIRPIEAPGVPSGVYYRQSTDRGGSWTAGELLYPSQYFRGMDPEDANVSIASVADGEGTRVYVVWDNPARKQVFFSISSDNGESWSDPIEILYTGTSTGYTHPFGITVGAFGKYVTLIWQIGDPIVGCKQVYQWSADGGESWTSPAGMPTNTYGCPGNNQVLSSNDLIYLMTSIQDEIYLLAWNGNQWSNPEYQRTLTGFEDPETQDMVLFACQSPVLLPDGQMFVVGCDKGKGGDIWGANRSVSDTDTWFPPPSVWENQSQVLESSSPIFSPELIADSQGVFHAFWIQAEASGENAASVVPSAVYYSGYDGLTWSRPSKILTSPNGDADQPSLAIDNLDRLMVVWREKQSGSIFFSWANANRASGPSEWASPVSLPAIKPLAISPMITVERSGRVYVVFSIPINEDRGIYITASDDVGQTWSNPVRVVDAIAAGWEMVDEPQIAITGDGNIHVIWKVTSVIGETTPQGIYYAYSDDEGVSWSNPMELVESQTYWSEMASNGDREIRLVWQDKIVRGFVLREQVSKNGGQTWSRATKMMDLGDSIEPASLSEWAGNQAFLFLIDVKPMKSGVLNHWIWMGDELLAEASLDLSVHPSVSFTGLDSAIASQGRLGMIYSQEEPSSVKGKQIYKLLFVDREILQLASLPTPATIDVLQPTEVITATASTLVAPTPAPTITPNPVPPAPPVATGRSMGEMILGVVMISAVIGMSIGLAVIIIKRRG